MRLKIAAFILAFSSLTAVAAETDIGKDNKKGFFSIGGFYGMESSRLLNESGSYANYKTSNFGLDLDILVWAAGTGDIRLFATHQETSGSDTSTSANGMTTSETAAGLKIYAGESVYFEGGIGHGQAKLTSTAPELKLSYDLLRIGAGVEIPVTEGLFIALEAAYKNAPISKTGNDALSQNSYMDGIGGFIRFVWSPPAITNVIVSTKRK